MTLLREEDFGEMPTHVVLFGNPGAGKSTLLNTLTGTREFASGVKVGRGMTERLQTRAGRGRLYTDTPGLDDGCLREAAASAASEVLSEGGEFVLVFVATLEAGRVRAGDVAAMHVVLEGVERAGVRVAGAYSVWLNKCLAAEMGAADAAPVIDTLRWRGSAPRVRVIARHAAIACAQRAVLPYADALALEHAIADAPRLRIPKGVRVSVDAGDYAQRMRDIERRLDEARRTHVRQLGMLLHPSSQHQQQHYQHHQPSSRGRKIAIRAVRFAFSLLGLVTVSAAVIAAPTALHRATLWFAHHVVQNDRVLTFAWRTRDNDAIQQVELP